MEQRTRRTREARDDSGSRPDAAGDQEDQPAADGETAHRDAMGETAVWRLGTSRLGLDTRLG